MAKPYYLRNNTAKCINYKKLLHMRCKCDRLSRHLSVTASASSCNIETKNTNQKLNQK